MRYRWTATTLAAAAVALSVAGCNPDDTPSATTSMPTVVVTTTMPASTTSGAEEADSGTAVEKSDSQDGGATQASGGGSQTARPLPPGHGVGSSAFVGDWTRHASSLDLAGDQTGTLLMGSGALNTEKWSVTWTRRGMGITITIGDLIVKSGEGVGDISKGETVSGDLSTGAHGGPTLVTKGLGDTGGPLTWCRAASAGTPACGA